MDNMRFHKTAALVLALLLAMVVLAPAIAQQNDQAEVMLQAAHNKQLVDGDLSQAIQMYKKILSEYSSNRPVAAKALVEMGDCYEKLGKSEAQNTYQRVLRDYADQSAEANEARARLAALNHGGTHGSEMVTRRIWAGPDVDDEGATSPDGKYLTYVDWDTGDLAVLDLATGQKRRLTHAGTLVGDEDFAGSPIPSPDGKQIAYGWYDGKDFNYGLRVIGRDGSHQRTLYNKGDDFYIDPEAWSPDGKQILAVLKLNNQSSQLVMIDVADGALRVLKNFKPGPFGLSTMGFSPDGRYIAYTFPQKSDETHNDVFLLSADGSRDFPLVAHPADDYFLGWAPHGKTVLFASDRTGAFGVWAIEVLDGKPHGSPRLVKSDIGRINPLGFTRNGSFYYSLSNSVRDLYSAAFDFDSGKLLASPHAVSERFTGANAAPAWSPDGKYLAYLSRRHKLHTNPLRFGADTIVIRSFATGEEREIVPNLRFLNTGQGFRWSPDGHSLLPFAVDRGGHWDLFRVDVQTGKASVLIQPRQPGEGGCWSPRVTPDGKTLIYANGANGGRVGQFLAQDLETGQVRQIRDITPLDLSGLALSPDGRQIAFETQARGAEAPALKITSVAGGEPHVIYRLKNPAEFPRDALAWTPDGSHIVFGVRPGGWHPSRQRTELWEIAVDGGKAQKLDLSMEQITQLRISPAGHQIAFEAGTSSKEIDVMQNLLPALKASR
jgi:Tol biopolymer transport system component